MYEVKHSETKGDFECKGVCIVNAGMHAFVHWECRGGLHSECEGNQRWERSTLAGYSSPTLEVFGTGVLQELALNAL